MLRTVQGLGTEEAHRSTAAAFIQARSDPIHLCWYTYTYIVTVLHLCIVHSEN